MKILTANFLTCAVKACKTSPASYPLHFRDAELELVEMEYNPLFLRNILPCIEWDALKTTAAELGFADLPSEKPTLTASSPEEKPGDGEMEGVEEASEVSQGDVEKISKELHRLLLETQVTEGKMVCGNCGHEYRIKEGIANFLLPSHLV